MATFSADPVLLDTLANNLEGDVDIFTSNGTSAASLCRLYGYAGSAATVEGRINSSSMWASAWVASIRQRSDLLRTYEEIALFGSGAAGGAGPALGAARSWALGESGTALSFQEWYAEKLASLAELERAKGLAGDLEAAIDGEDYEAAASIIGDLEELSPEAAATFFNELGPESIAKIPARLVAMHIDAPYLGVNHGLPQDLMVVVSAKLAEASMTDRLTFGHEG